MFDIGWTELLLIGVLILFLFGPEDIPKIMYNLGRIVKRFKYMKFALSSQFDDFMEKAEASAQGKNPPPTPEAAKVVHDDEMDDDLHLLEMMPPPANVSPINVSELDDIEHDPKRTPTDRG